MKLRAIFIAGLLTSVVAQAQTWIWYPGDMEIWTGNRINNLRTESGAFYPAFWRADSHWQTVEFSKKLNLAEPEEVEIKAEGQFGIKIDSHYLFGMPASFTMPAGSHTLRICVSNLLSPPTLWLSGKTIKSDTTWTVSNLADAERAETWTDNDGTAMFATVDSRPSAYRLPVEAVSPTATERNGNTLFASFSREAMGYLQLNGVEGNGTVHVYYGESPAEAQDDRAYLVDRVRFTADSIIDLQTLTRSRRNGSSYRLACSRAMRYVRIVCDGGVSVGDVIMQQEMKPLRQRGTFTSSDTLLNHIWDVAAYTLHLTDREVMIEGIKRDRWMWSGDAIQSYLMNYYSLMDAAVVRRTIRALRGKDPVRQHINTILDYTLYWFNSIYDYYLYTGDSEFLSRVYPSMLSLMAWVECRLDDRGMVEGKPGDWVFVDWSPKPMSKKGELAFEQMVYLRSLQAMSLCAGVVGDKANKEKYTGLADKLRSQLTPVFWDQSRHLFVHTVVDGRQSSEVTRYANMFAVLYDFADAQQQSDILKNVLLSDSVMPITTPYMQFYELEALCKLGKQRLVMDKILSYWGGMIKQGATTFWETYDPRETYPERLAMYGHPYGKSQCHAWGASPIYLLGKYYLGVRPTEPGYKAWECKPNLGGLKWMKGDVPTPKGNIHIEMDRKHVSIEANGCGAGMLVLPNGKSVSVGEGQKVNVRY